MIYINLTERHFVFLAGPLNHEHHPYRHHLTQQLMKRGRLKPFANRAIPLLTLKQYDKEPELNH